MPATQVKSTRVEHKAPAPVRNAAANGAPASAPEPDYTPRPMTRREGFLFALKLILITVSLTLLLWLLDTVAH